jgi:hypothetical protein
MTTEPPLDDRGYARTQRAPRPELASPVPPGRLFAALEVRNFRRYVAGQSLSLIGTWIETVAQALLVLKVAHSGFIFGATTAVRFAPVLLLSPYAGSWSTGFPSARFC